MDLIAYYWGLLIQSPYCHKRIPLLLERAEDAGHGIDRGGVDVVHEDDSAWPRTSNGTVADDGAIAIGPVARIDRPQDGGHTALAQLLEDDTVHCAIWWAHDSRRSACCLGNSIVGSVDLATDCFCTILWQNRMAPRVIPELVTAGVDATHDVSTSCNFAADHEECAFCTILV